MSKRDIPFEGKKQFDEENILYKAKLPNIYFC